MWACLGQPVVCGKLNYHCENAFFLAAKTQFSLRKENVAGYHRRRAGVRRGRRRPLPRALRRGPRGGHERRRRLDRANFTGLVLGCIEADFCNQR